MLKLEKVAEGSGLSIRLRERERFFEPQLIKALLFALFLHGGALLLFKIAPLHLSSNFVFAPIQVESDHTSQNSVVFASTSYDETEINQPPPINLFSLIEWPLLNKEPDLISSLPLDLNAFQSLEEHFWPKWQESLPINLAEPRIKLIVSGDLARFPLEFSDPLLNQMQSINEGLIPAFVNYDVQVNGKTGELIWYDRTLSSETKDIDRLTENILFNLRFSPSESDFIIKGTLNFIVRNHANTIE